MAVIETRVFCFCFCLFFFLIYKFANKTSSVLKTQPLWERIRMCNKGKVSVLICELEKICTGQVNHVKQRISRILTLFVLEQILG